jgi:hypothetical protein
MEAWLFLYQWTDSDAQRLIWEYSADCISWLEQAAALWNLEVQKNIRRLSSLPKFPAHKHQHSNHLPTSANSNSPIPLSINSKMFSKSLLATAAVVFFAAQAAAAPSAMAGSNIEASSNESRAVQIAPDAINACNCPNNCQHKLGDSCKFYKEGYIITAGK